MALSPIRSLPAAADIYTIAVGDWQADDPRQEVGAFGSIAISSNLDSGCECTFDVPGNSPAAQEIDELATDVWLYRSGSVRSRYRIVAVEQTWGPDGGDVVSVTAVCYKRLMASRHVISPLAFSATPQAEIIRDLIEHTQSQPGGDLGITVGTLDSGGVSRERNYVRGENLGQILDNMQNVIDGPWWEIDGGKRLNVKPFSAFPTRLTPLQLGVNVRSLTRSSGASAFANVVYVDGDKAATTPVVELSPTVETDPRGRWERAVGFPNVILQSTLDEKAEGLVESLRTPLAQWSAQIEPERYLLDSEFSPGDFVTIVVPATVAAPIGNPGFSVPAQVLNVSLNIDADGGTAVSMELIEVRP